MIEFWPDYGPGPLWGDAGQSLQPEEVGVPSDLAARLLTWNSEYAEDKIPAADAQGDPAYLDRGVELLAETRDALRDLYEVVVTEPWWGEDPAS